jgi:hypothetical protein
MCPPKQAIAIEPFEISPGGHGRAIALRANLFNGHDPVLLK